MVRPMAHNDYTSELEQVWQRGLKAYQQGLRGPAVFDAADTAFLAGIGCSAQEAYDFVDDHVRYGGQPDYTTFALLADIRRDYFLNVQQGRPSGRIVAPESLPAKTDAVDGIVWLPRLIAKAQAKLRGELDPDTMYGCAGDRGFFERHGLHPAEFLRAVERAGSQTEAVVAWVKARV